jgi:hypothetical protein
VVEKHRRGALEVDSLDTSTTSESCCQPRLWTAATPFVTVFQIAKSRGAVVAKQMPGKFFSGFLVVDHWAAYEWVECRQLC